MKNWTDRLNYVLALREKNAADLVRATSLSPAGIKKWIDGQVKKPSYEDIKKVCDYLKVSPEWLMDGLGVIDEEPSTDMVEIEKIEVSGSCGFGTINFEEVPGISKLQVSQTWFKKYFYFYNPENIKIVTAQGDSMTPEIDDGEAVFIDISDKDTLRDGIYLLMVDGELFIKRVQKLIGKKIALISSNPKYKEIEVPLDTDIEVRVIGRVVKAMKLTDL